VIPATALLDTSVLLRVMIDQGDELQSNADIVADAIGAGLLEPLILDLSIYEAINVLTGKLGLDAGIVDGLLHDVFEASWPLVTLDADLAYRAGALAGEYGLSGYDASFVAAAEQLGVPLISADAEMIDAAGPAALALWDVVEP
jgi:predicted nucleic acid-binding protein